MAETIQAEMAATVWKILVSQGDRVEEDDPMMILESMKMEIPVLAESTCTVIAVRVAEGDSIASGQPLFDVEAE